ncbi:hypothetical protein QCB45_08130 [Thiomicrorhabdus sp. ZW0627]|uniref:hypothetical protein n=1 Tax=Thiomicrorhabdus sp. ZW0627 TaxID=3039774 RepID=UPI002436E8CC|nr:hypothetical protein [Thiomicrorhabdus sp. ZW0627]MDG6774299.1 hypothetical protein [Thiomicrorhabdus sp. ZW0627]
MKISSRLYMFILFASCLIPMKASAETPSHVFQQAADLENQILAIRNDAKIRSKLAQPAVQTNKLPVHVYSKAIELNQKIIRLQKKMNLSVAEQKTIPIKEITPNDVYEIVAFLNAELGKVTQSKGLTYKHAEFVDGKTPSNVYEKMMEASLAIDDLIGPINPNQVFRNSEIIDAEFDTIAKKMQVKIPDRTVPLDKSASPYDSTIEGFMNLYKIAKLERKLGIPAVRVADFPIGKITPTEVYDMTNNILAELVRIKAKLGITEPAPTPALLEGKKPFEVHQLMVKVGRKIDALAQ